MNLSGLIAVIDEGQVIEVRDLGPVPVACKPGRALPLVDLSPPLGEGEMYGEPVYVIGPDSVTRTHEILPSPLEPVVETSPIDKLSAFLDANPDVKALLT